MDTIFAEPWQIYLALAVLVLIFELSTFTMYTIPFGIAFILTAGLSFFVHSIEWQLASIGFFTLVATFWVRQFHVRTQGQQNLASNVHSLVGKQVKVTEAIPAGERGRVQIFGESWLARFADGAESSEPGDLLEVEKVESSTLIVKKQAQKGE